jgi:hypothetical protein
MALMRIRVMISSRCNDPVKLDGKDVKFSDLRRRIKREIEAARLSSEQWFEVWINEDAPAAEGSADSWEQCLEQARSADVVLVLYNGNGGWCKEGGDIGICHAELETALASAGNRVRLIGLPLQPMRAGPMQSVDKRFRDFAERQNLFRSSAEDGNGAIARSLEALQDGVARMTRDGAHAGRRLSFDSGEALNWSRLQLEPRRLEMEKVLRAALGARTGAEDTNGQIFVRIGGKSVLALCHAIPAAMTVAPAREMVGQPFLNDYRHASALQGARVGPVHFIACHRSVTESQAMKVLGFPDATIISPSFGVYLADNVQKIQLVFVANCRDESGIRHGLQRVFDWMERTGEEIQTAARAAARARIVRAIAKEAEPLRT